MSENVIATVSYSVISDLRKILNNLGYKKDDVLTITQMGEDIIADFGIGRVVKFPPNVFEFKTGTLHTINIVDVISVLRKAEELFEGNSELMITYDNSTYIFESGNLSINTPAAIIDECEFENKRELSREILKIINNEPTYKISGTLLGKFLNVNKNEEYLRVYFERNGNIYKPIAFSSGGALLVLEDELPTNINKLENIIFQNPDRYTFVEYVHLLKVKYPDSKTERINIFTEYNKENETLMLCFNFNSKQIYKTIFDYEIAIYDFGNISSYEDDMGFV